MDSLVSLPTELSLALAKMDINFHWGKQEELLRYLHSDSDDKNYEIFLSSSERSSFPLAWLVSGWLLKPLDTRLENKFKGSKVKIVFMRVTDKTWGNKETGLSVESWTTKGEENFAIRGEDATLEHVDAVILDLEIEVYLEKVC